MSVAKVDTRGKEDVQGSTPLNIKPETCMSSYHRRLEFGRILVLLWYLKVDLFIRTPLLAC